jgi:hypothetical protein
MHYDGLALRWAVFFFKHIDIGRGVCGLTIALFLEKYSRMDTRDFFPGDLASLYHIFACFTACFIFLSDDVDDVDDVIWAKLLVTFH